MLIEQREHLRCSIMTLADATNIAALQAITVNASPHRDDNSCLMNLYLHNATLPLMNQTSPARANDHRSDYHEP